MDRPNRKYIQKGDITGDGITKSIVGENSLIEVLYTAKVQLAARAATKATSDIVGRYQFSEIALRSKSRKLIRSIRR